MADGTDNPETLHRQELELIIAGVSTTPEARAAAKALLLQGLVTDAGRILSDMQGDMAALKQSVLHLKKLQNFLELSPLSVLAEKVARIGAKLRGRLEGGVDADVSPSEGEPARAGASAAPQDGVAPQPSVNPSLPAQPPVDILDTPDAVPVGQLGTLISARRTAHKTVVYIDVAGREVVREGGSRGWRNNNPGNIRRGNFSESHGAIGDDGAFAIFPDEGAGYDAIVSLLRSPSYASLTLEGAIARYAPPAENDTHSYIEFVADETGLAQSVRMDTLPIAKNRAIAKAIKKKEGWIEGAERLLSPVDVTPGLAGAVSSAAGAVQEWMAVAEAQAALPEPQRSEWPDPGENPRILEYFRTAAAWFDAGEGDETDWCAAFVNYCLIMAGHEGTNHPGARSFFWNKNNQFVRLSSPRHGCIGVRRYAPFEDPTWRSGAGHVGFVTSSTELSVTLLGGNQGKTVSRKSYQLETQSAVGEVESKFVAFLMPAMN